MPPLQFQPAHRYSLDVLSVLFTRAYTDYYVPVHFTGAGFESMIAAYDIDLSASRVGVVGQAPAALALLGVRGPRGWIGGMGVVPEQRGERAGRAITEAVIDAARRLKLRSINLEVLTQNLPAVRIYEALGFRRQRLLDVWRRDSDATFPMPPRQVVQPLDVSACLALFEELHAVAPPWQRDLPTLQRTAAALHALGIAEDGRITAYLLYRMDNAQVSVLDLAAAPGQRTAAIESMLRALIRDRAGSPIHLANLPQDDPASNVMHLIGAQVQLQQHEMTLEL
ncbi:MAG TPA: GNAT family N-acetyltransferase [Anaerolineae bacterium]|nr:GNAT family N-acetyltransferase [Anaerolineae bacterium]